MASRGGPALGDTIIGWFASLLGPVSALSLGSLVPIGYAALLYARSARLREYRGLQAEDETPAGVTPA
jgi:hypothetical protein